MRMAMFPLALFDLDNTLFDRTGTYRMWAAQFVSGAGLPGEAVDWFVRADKDGLADRYDVWLAARGRFGLAGTVEELVRTYRSTYFDCMRPDDEVLAALRRLRTEGWRIGVVTNGPMPEQEDKASRLGLMELVDGFCASGDLGVEKPDGRIFAEAIRRCAAPSPPTSVQALWMVGDAPGPDMAGGRAMGLGTVWVYRGRRWQPADGAPPDITVASVVEAVDEILAVDP
jgi:FMN phosphatase YigB (HAD superfamily)